MRVPVRLVELWLTLVHGALCRQVAGGLLVQLPLRPQLLIGEGAESSPNFPLANAIKTLAPLCRVKLGLGEGQGPISGRRRYTLLTRCPLLGALKQEMGGLALRNKR